MLYRLLPAFVLMMPVAYGQSGIYGTATGHPKAGDTAPDLVYSQVLSAPVQGSWSQPNLSGQVTVLGFFPDTSHNPQPVAEWNARVDQYAQRHVQFVWITGEDKRTLMPALPQHAIKGWVLYDPDGSIAKAFGLDMPVNVYIGPNRKIIGFQVGAIPDEQTLNAVLEGRVVLTRPTPATIKSFRESSLVALDSVPARMRSAEDYRPQFAPSTTVHITPSVGGERGNFSSDDYLVLQGFTIKEAIEKLYDLNAVRIELPPSLDSSGRYDFAMLLPQRETSEEMKERFKQALREHFHLIVEREVRLTDVYVVSHQPGREPPIEKPSSFDLPGQRGGGSRASSVGFTGSKDFIDNMEQPRAQSLDALFSIAEEGTIDDLCHDLEGSLDRPVVNETHLEGRYRVQVQTLTGAKANFVVTLREQTGLVIRPDRRKITFLKFRTMNERPAGNTAELH
jgi:uncharacterized protein (TIGR03435 family)